MINVGEVAKGLKVGDVIAEVYEGETHHYMICRQVVPVGDYSDSYEYATDYVLVNLSTACVTEIVSPTIEGLIKQLSEPFMGIEIESVYKSKLKHVHVKEQ